MARALIWTPEAIQDVDAIASFIGRDSRWHARAVASKIFDVAESVPQNPLLGRLVPEIGDPGIRERFVYSYRLIYRVEKEAIFVVAVVHAGRLIGPSKGV